MYASAAGDEKTASLYKHIGKEEDRHEEEFKQRFNELLEINPHIDKSWVRIQSGVNEGTILSIESWDKERAGMVSRGETPPAVEYLAKGVDKLLPALKPFEPYHFAEYVLRYNSFSDDEIPIYSGTSGQNPFRVPDHVWREVIEGTDGKFIKQGDLNVFHMPEKGRPEYMRAAPDWKEIPATKKLTRDEVEVYVSLPPFKASIWVDNKDTGETIWHLDGAENINRFSWKDQNRDQLEERVLTHLEDIGVLANKQRPAAMPTNDMPACTEFIPFNIEDIGFREKLDTAMLGAIARVKEG